ncbi:uncharacterized protein METZ01_LOCUS492591, partial [marine metagenome]
VTFKMYYNLKNKIRLYLGRKKNYMKIIWRAYIFQFYKDQTNNLPNGSIVYIADRTISPGGLMDILKGIISLYDFAKENKIPFFIFL